MRKSFVLVSFATFVACGGGTKSGAPGGGTSSTPPSAPPPSGVTTAPAPPPPAASKTIDAATAASREAQAICVFDDRCATLIPGTVSTAVCEAKAAKVLVEQAIPGALYDEDAVSKAVACYASATCDALYGSGIDGLCPLPPPVNRYAIGAACNADSACESGFCKGLAAGACGVCAAPNIVPLGTECDDGAGTRCAAGQECIVSCTRFGRLGEPCDSDLRKLGGGSTPCGLNLLCDAGSSVCVKAEPVGGACSTFECDGLRGAACDTSQHLCTAVTYGVADIACSPGTARSCRGDLFCAAPIGATGTCQPIIADGQPCVANEYGCDIGSDCNGGVCVRYASERPICK